MYAIFKINSTPTPLFHAIDGDFSRLLSRYPSITAAPKVNHPVKDSVRVHLFVTKGQLPFCRP